MTQILKPTALDRAVGVLADAADNGYADSAPIWLRAELPPFTIGDLRELIIAAGSTRHSDPDELREALVEQTLLVDRLCSAVDQAAEDIGHESIDDLLKLIGPHNERCIEILGGRTALSRHVGDVG